MRVVGLIGGVASGKSTVAAEFAKLGAQVLNADHIVHSLLGESDIKAQLKSTFGDAIFDSDGNVSRQAVAKRVFGEDETSQNLRKQLEEVLHPAVRGEAEKLLSQWRSQNVALAVIDAPLLIEAGWSSMCDAILFVDTPQKLREKWAAQRGWSVEELSRRETSQMALSEKRERATHLILNDGNLLALAARVSQFWQDDVVARVGPKSH
jgi:dephospho-CoA kinase